MLQIGTIYRSEEVDRRLPRAGNIGGEMGVADGKKKKLSFDSDENILKLILMMVAHLSEYTKPLNHSLNW